MIGQAGPRRRTGGLTLIELMVSLVVFGLVVAATAKLGKNWLDANKVTKGQGLVQQAYSVAKTNAMRNPTGQTGTAPAAVLCLSGDVLRVYVGGSCSGSVLWTATLPGNTTVTANAAAPTCFAFTNQGLSTAGTAGCSTATAFTVSSGSSNVTKKFF